MTTGGSRRTGQRGLYPFAERRAFVANFAGVLCGPGSLLAQLIFGLLAIVAERLHRRFEVGFAGAGFACLVVHVVVVPTSDPLPGPGCVHALCQCSPFPSSTIAIPVTRQRGRTLPVQSGDARGTSSPARYRMSPCIRIRHVATAGRASGPKAWEDYFDLDNLAQDSRALLAQHVTLRPLFAFAHGAASPVDV